MAAQYDFQRRPNPKGDGELQPLYPRIVNKGTIDTERLVSDISRMSSFSPGDINGLLAAIEDRIIYPKDIMFSWAVWDTSRQV